MKRAASTRRIVILAALAVTLLGAGPSAAAHASTTLRTLALRAQSRRGWHALRRYAHSARGNESCLAYFALGYREYQARSFAIAAADLREAAASGCSLSEFAEYYEALARRAADQYPQAIRAANNLVAQYPQGVFRVRAGELLADLLIHSGHPNQALRVLSQLPGSYAEKPAALLLRARADEATQSLIEAAKLYQQIYYGFPTAGEAAEAKSALQRLRPRLGKNLPAITDELETERARKLFAHGEFERALAEYDALLLSGSHNPLAGQWQLGRARCLLALRRYPEAAEALKERQHGASARQDAERLALLTEAYSRAADEPAMLKTLDEAYKRYPHSPSYAEALFVAGGYFARQGYWQTAAQYYQPLCEGFPGSRRAPEAAWRLAWYDVLAGRTEEARSALLGYLKTYSGSLQTPAALYWLARLEEEGGAADEARALDRLIVARYGNSFYGWEARRKLERRPGAVMAADMPAQPAILTQAGITLPAEKHTEDVPCQETNLNLEPLLAPYQALESLALDDLAAGYLQDVAARYPSNPGILLTLARAQAERGDTALALFSARQAVPDYAELSFNRLPREVWDFLYPQAYWRLVRRYARANRLDPYLVMGIIRQESAFNPRATSGARARGLMQMEPETATRRVRGRRRRRYVTRELYNPSYNIRVSCRYLRSLWLAFDGRPVETLAAYNAGDFRVRQWLQNSKLQDPAFFIESIPFTDTRAYVELVLRDAQMYRSILTGAATFRKCGEYDRRG
ncbi:MAG: transglycosylase SLT domain-containing protein [Terriglobia bacterium]